MRYDAVLIYWWLGFLAFLWLGSFFTKMPDDASDIRRLGRAFCLWMLSSNITAILIFLASRS